MKPMSNVPLEEGSGRVEALLLWTLRGKTKGAYPNTDDLERFQRQLYRLCREEGIRYRRTNRQPMEQEPASVQRTIAAKVRAALRAEDWVICARNDGEELHFDLAYGLEGDRVLLDGQREMPIEEWQRQAIYYWIVTLTFPALEPPFRGENTSRVELLWLQRQLNWILDAHLPMSGEYTPETAQAVEAFRRRMERKAGGYLEPLEEDLAQRLEILPLT